MADKVLIVEDEEVVRELLEGWLEDAGYETLATRLWRRPMAWTAYGSCTASGPTSWWPTSFVPNMDGFELCRLAREVCEAPIMILSGLGKEEDKVKGLNLGADDYVVKPVPMGEFLARVAALLRRRERNGDGPPSDNIYRDDVLTIDGDRNEVWVRGDQVQFTPTEFKLLSLLTERAGKTCSTREILDRVWDTSHYSPELVKWHISSLRGKVERDVANPQCVVTVRGVGYRYDGAMRASVASQMAQAKA